ncbi:membrane protein required for colicin V production [Catalinimonas alkaloidigena]|uniref:CvpA family protein n=1 Tax=Catalinimonas alkaloidigena TaxID=1075417 RepID=UPI002406F303|nr:CvpA family protein [Catalinimonas alkaloidigena]MDF9800934.1 membrane protein required for colicin V production [Catalinimonas alkaloidigena]
MSIWDFVILVILLAGAYRGFQKGLLREVVGIFALVAGVIGAIQWLPEGMDFLSRTLNTQTELLPVFAFFLIFITIVLAISLAGRLVKLIIDLTPIGFVDGIGGALLGMLKWALGISIILWVMDNARVELPIDDESMLYVNVKQVAPYIFQHLGEWSPMVAEVIDSIQQIFAEIEW